MVNQILGRTRDGKQFFAMILEPGNLKRIQAGDPISIHLEDFFPDGIPKKLDVAIMFSDTPIADTKELAKRSEIVLDERSSKTVRPHCGECGSTVEQLGMFTNESPIALVFCSQCGRVFGVTASPKT